MNRWLLVLGLPFSICVVGASIVGGLIIKSDPNLADSVNFGVGFFMVIMTPIMIILLWFVSKPKSSNMDNKK